MSRGLPKAYKNGRLTIWEDHILGRDKDINNNKKIKLLFRKKIKLLFSLRTIKWDGGIKIHT